MAAAITLRPLTLTDMQTVRRWRDECRETLRTPYMLTEEMQAQYYRDVICNRDSKTRYWGLHGNALISYGRLVDGTRVAFGPGPNMLVGYGGLENISWENGNAEISLLIAPEHRRKGYGREAVKLFLCEAFDRMRLHSVYGECYESGVPQFWESLQPGYLTHLPARKFWNGTYFASMYFTFYREDYESLMRDSGEGKIDKNPGEKRQAVPRDTGDRKEPGDRESDWIRQGGGIE